MRASMIFTLLSVSLLSSLPAFAADCPVATGEKLLTTTPVIARTSPPENEFLFLIGKPGAKVADIKVGTVVTVKDCAAISAPFRTDLWIRGETATGVSGWIYSGSKTELTNFKMAE